MKHPLTLPSHGFRDCAPLLSADPQSFGVSRRLFNRTAAWSSDPTAASPAPSASAVADAGFETRWADYASVVEARSA